MRPRVVLALLLIMTALIYGVRLRHASFVYEDSNAVWANATVSGGQPIRVDRARWLSALSHRLVFEGFGAGPRAPHAVNIALHLINGVLVYAIALSLLAPWASVAASGLFLLHPLQTEAVAYVASRSELLSTCFALVSCLIALDARRWWEHLAVWGCVVAAICAKESSAVIVPIMAYLDVARERRQSRVRLAVLAVPIFAMAMSVFFYDFLNRSELGPLSFLATQATAFWRYVGLVVPIGQTIDHDFDLVPWAVRGVALVAVIVTALVPCYGCFTWGDEDGRTGRLWDVSPRGKIVCVGIAWTLLALSPRFVMRIPEYLNEHQTYLPFIGIYFMLGSGLMSRAHYDQLETP